MPSQAQLNALLNVSSRASVQSLCYHCNLLTINAKQVTILPHPEMSVCNAKRLHWTQRIALVQHNLHAASRGGDFTFFKALQAAEMMAGTNHFATLSATLGDEADAIMAAMDNLSSALAYTHQEAFLKVYNNIKDAMRDESTEKIDKSKIYSDITMQKNIAEATIDKLCNSAIALIQQQTDVDVQDQAANVFITGLTLIADCVEIVVKQLDAIDEKVDDFIRLEDAWNTVKASAMAANAGLKGVYYMLDTDEPSEAPRPMSVSSASSSVFRRLSTAFQGAQSSMSSTRNSSTSSTAPAQRNSVGGPAPIYRTPTSVRNSVSLGCPTSLPVSHNAAAFGTNSFENFDGDIFNNSFQPHKMDTIPSPAHSDEERDPLDTADMQDLPPMPAQPIDFQPGTSSVAVS